MNLVIEDEYVKKVGKYADENALELYEVICEYESILDDVLEGGIKAGDTADRLRAFVDQVESDTGKNSSTPYLIGNEAKRYCENFLLRVDKDDKDLY